MPSIPLSISLNTRPQARAIREGTVRPEGVDLQFVDVKPQIAAFRRMIRNLEFDICELAPTTYIAALDAGLPITALPIFLTRRFHHGDIVCRPGSGIGAPKDLQGRRVGVRAYTVSTGVWARGVLADDYDVDLDSITWVVDDEEHVTTYVLPPNVEHTADGESISSLFHAGRIDAALSGPAGIGRTGAPSAGWDVAGASFEDARKQSEDFYPLFPEAEKLERDWYQRTHIYPIHGLIAIKTEVLQAHPEVARSLTDAFVAAKQPFLEALAAGTGEGKEFDQYAGLSQIVGPDPLPFGIEDNRATLEALCDYSVRQHIVAKRPEVEDLFFQV
jgi:4,5-dihydroxyphthalate decarboxylase